MSINQVLTSWQSESLLAMWAVLQMPGNGNDGPFLDENDIYELKTNARTLNQELAALRAQVTALQAVAMAAEWYNDMEYGLTCPICDNSPASGHAQKCPYSAARAAGYLPTEGVSS